MVSVAETISRKLTQALSPLRLDILDESYRHGGHAGSRPEGETHFRVEIVAAAFTGKSRIERQRMVHQALAEELSGRIHALSLATYAPDEQS